MAELPEDAEDYADEDIALPPGKGEEKYSKFPPSMNIALEENMQMLENELHFPGSSCLTPTQNTLMLVSGFASGVAFHERDLIELIQPDIDILHCSSNFGKVTYDGYYMPVKDPRSNRGRKPRSPKKTRCRQKVGLGDDMNTQVCFWVRRATSPAIGDVVPRDAEIFKIKLFRTGDLQLTGSRLSTVRLGYQCSLKIIDMLNRVFYNGEPVVKLSPFVPVLKNYTLRIILPSLDHVVHLINLNRLIIIKQHYDNTGTLLCTNDLAMEVDPNEAPAHPKILHVAYSQQESRLTVAFATPLPWYPLKKLVMRLFVRGAIIIVGGLRAEDIISVCNFLHWLIYTNYPRVIVRQNTCYYEDNIAAEYSNRFFRRMFVRTKVVTRADLVRRYPDTPSWLIDLFVPLWDWQKKYPHLCNDA